MGILLHTNNLDFQYSITHVYGLNKKVYFQPVIMLFHKYFILILYIFITLRAIIYIENKE